MFPRRDRLAFALTALLFLAAAPRAWGDEAEDQYGVAAGHYARARWCLAAEEFGAFVARFPSHPRADQSVFFLAEALMQEGRAAEAQQRYAEYLRRVPDGPYAATAGFRLAEADYLAGRFDQARQKLEAFHASRPDDPLGEYVLPYLGEIALVQNDPALAADRFREAIQRYPTSGMKDDYRLGLARSLETVGSRDEAAALYRAIADEHLGAISAEARFRLGVAQYGAGSHADAVGTLLPLEDDAAAGPWRSRARLVRAMALGKLGRHDVAVELLDGLLAVGADGDLAAKAAAQLAINLAKLGKWEQSRKELERLLAQDPSHPAVAPAVEQLAETAYGAGDWPRAAEWFGWLAEKSGRPEYAGRGLAGLAWTQLNQEQFTEAAVTLQRLMDCKPQGESAVRAAWARGYVLERLDQPGPALASYRMVIDEHPASPKRPRVMLAAARLYARMKQRDEAAAAYQRLAKEYPAQAELDAVLYEWSGVLADLGRWDEADRLLRRLHEEFPKSSHWADAAERLAQRAESSGDRDRARQLVEQTLAAKSVSASTEERALALACRLAVADERWEELARSAGQLLEKHPESPYRPAAEYWIAESFYRRGDEEAAAARLDALLAKLGKAKAAWMGMIPLRRAQIFAKAKQWTEAYELASTIERDFPGFERQYEVDYLLGRSLAARAKFDEAREAYGRVIHSVAGARTETAAMAQWMIGETYFHQKDHSAALREYLRVEILYDYPRWQAAAVLQAGKCYEATGRPDEAVKLYRRVLSDYPKTPFVAEAKERLLAAKQSNANEARKPSPDAPARQ